ncbi:hypothetical protein SeMB42_g04582 [Synchytrium endobioticum]|uniref:Cilia- and flagella-associated protein 263 n=1 Tax=Synchytrium endobioticum TaxID=286115 RepID=A0A507CX59_9FUNG|nr:hypothetical protein SeMB42_g04582 [Synchytrium endobioticum]TPX48510.1 hypothetical protein SeLEV6574_g02001 [Synchytrium endobioticum]
MDDTSNVTSSSVESPTYPSDMSQSQASQPTATDILVDATTRAEEVDTCTNAELALLLAELMKKNVRLETENKLFESYLERVGPLLPDDVLNAMNGSKGGKNGDGRNTDLNGPGLNGEEKRKKKGDRNKGSEQEKIVLLTPEQRAEVASRALDELRDDIEREKEGWTRFVDNLKAEIEEVEIRTAEIKKAMYEFKRDVVQSAISERTGKVMAERVQRWIEDHLRAKDAIIEKLRLKNASLKSQRNNLAQQLRQKEEMGDVLHAIDFDQLQIENKQYLVRIEERNTELVALKSAAGTTQHLLNTHKDALMSTMKDSERLVAEIENKREMLTKLIEEEAKVNADIKKIMKTNGQFQDLVESYRVPQVMDYVHTKALQLDLERKVGMWERKVEIAALQLRRTKRAFKSATGPITAEPMVRPISNAASV